MSWWPCFIHRQTLYLVGIWRKPASHYVFKLKVALDYTVLLQLQPHFSPATLYKRLFQEAEPPSCLVSKAQSPFPSEQHHKAPLLQGAEACRRNFSPSHYQRLLRHADRVSCALELTVSEVSLNPTEALQWNSTDARSNPRAELAAFSTWQMGSVWRMRRNYFTWVFMHWNFRVL